MAAVMKSQRLTKKLVEDAISGASDFIVWDRGLAGFGLRVRASGSKTFIAQYRAGGGRSGVNRRFTICRFGVLTVDEARASAKRVLASVVHGFDPSGE